MTRRRKNFSIAIIVIILILFAMTSEDFMLRAAVFVHSPRSALTMEYEPVGDNTNREDLYAITKNAPVEKATQGILTTWVVHHYGPFKIAGYYGEC